MYLINHPPPIEFESLTSYLERLRIANHYDEKAWYCSFLPEYSSKWPNAWHDQSFYAVIGELTGVKIEILKSMSFQSYIAHFYLPEELNTLPRDIEGMPYWDQRRVKNYIVPYGTPRICPKCWQAYHALFIQWSFRQVTMCFEHKILLVDACSRCRRPLKWDDDSGTTSCCGIKLSTLPQVSVIDQPGALGLMDITEQAIRTDIKLVMQPDHITQPEFLSSASLLYFLWRMSELIFVRDSENPLFNLVLAANEKVFPRLDDMPNHVIHAVLVGVYKIFFTDWPVHWHMTLDRLADIEKQGTGFDYFPYKLARLFPGTHYVWLWQSWAEYMWLKLESDDPRLSAWIRYFTHMEKYFGVRLDDSHTLQGEALSPLLTKRDAAQQLHLGDRSLQEHLAKGNLHTIAPRSSENKRQWQLVHADSVRQLQEKLQSRLLTPQVAAIFKISSEHILALVKNNILHAEQGPSIDGKSAWIFDKERIHRDFSALFSHFLICPLPPADRENWMTLERTLRKISATGESLQTLMHAVINRRVNAFWDGVNMKMDTIWFQKHDIANLLGSKKERAFFTTTEVCQQLRCKPKILIRWLETGLLVPDETEATPTGVVRRYNKDKIREFQQTYIKTEKASQLLESAYLTIQKWARLGTLLAVSGPTIDGCHEYLFDKTYLIEWHQRHLPLKKGPQQILGVSRPTIYRWIKLGILKPTLDMGKGNFYINSEDIEQLCSLNAKYLCGNEDSLFSR